MGADQDGFDDCREAILLMGMSPLWNGFQDGGMSITHRHSTAGPQEHR